MRVLPALVELGGARRDLLARDAAGAVTDELMGVREFVVQLYILGRVSIVEAIVTSASHHQAATIDVDGLAGNV